MFSIAVSPHIHVYCCFNINLFPWTTKHFKIFWLCLKTLYRFNTVFISCFLISWYFLSVYLEIRLSYPAENKVQTLAHHLIITSTVKVQFFVHIRLVLLQFRSSAINKLHICCLLLFNTMHCNKASPTTTVYMSAGFVFNSVQDCRQISTKFFCEVVGPICEVCPVITNNLLYSDLGLLTNLYHVQFKALKFSLCDCQLFL